MKTHNGREVLASFPTALYMKDVSDSFSLSARLSKWKSSQEPGSILDTFRELRSRAQSLHQQS